MILRDIDGRHLEANVRENGDLVIEGQDLGDAVESAFGPGIREYEWAWTVRSAHVPALAKALGCEPAGVLAALGARFRHPDSHLLLPFLETHEIPLERWSRMGD